MAYLNFPAGALVAFSCRRPRAVALAALLLVLAAAVFCAARFEMTTDTAALISATVDYRRSEAAMDRAFPGATDTTLVVVQGETSEIAEDGANRLFQALARDRVHFRRAERPDGGPFFAREGLLFRTPAEVRASMDQLIASEGFLGPLAADPSLRGVMTVIGAMAAGARQGAVSLDAVRAPLDRLAAAFEALEAGRPAFFSWRSLIEPGPSGGAPDTRFILVQPRLDYGALEPGAAASAAIRAAAARLGLDPAHGARVRLTGQTPLSDEEFASLTDHAWAVGGAMAAMMILMLWLAVRSLKVMAAILAATLAGLILTAAAGLLAVGRFNLISVAFIPLFVGLGVDFGIQMSVRYREERRRAPSAAAALERAAAGIGGALALAAAAIALGFFAFIPTAYVGISELGVVAGLGMVLALVLSLTVLPALLVLLDPPVQTGEVGTPRLRGLDALLVRRRGLVLLAFALSLAGSVALLPLVRFDFNPLHLKNPRGEAMATLSDLMKDPLQSPNAIDVLEPDLAQAQSTAMRLSALKEVSQAVTLESFVPDDQAPKLAAIAEAATLLDPTLNPFEVAPAPSDADERASLRSAGNALLSALAAPGAPGPGRAAAERLLRALKGLEAGDADLRRRADQMVSAPLEVLLGEIRTALAAEPVSLAGLPSDLRADWVAPDGKARIEVFPQAGPQDNAALVRFAAAVRRIAPNASGGPISIQGAGRTISQAFIEAGILSLIVITLLLLAALRSVRETLFTLAPIVLSGFLTLGTCVLIGQPINYANIIAFPLLFGVGVAFHIYFVMAWRSGARDLLQSSLARAIFFSALTTGAAFAALMLSSHPGTASMGKILMIALFWTLVCALLFEPALLGPAPADGSAPRRPRAPPPSPG